MKTKQQELMEKPILTTSQYKKLATEEYKKKQHSFYGGW